MKRFMVFVLGIIGLITQIEAVETIQINEIWKVDEISFSLKIEQSFNEDHVKFHKDISINFHKEDFLKSGGPDFYGYSMEFFDLYANQFLDLNADKFKKGEASLLLIKKQDEIIGGTYYIPEEEGKTICMYSVGFRFDLSQNELDQAQIKLIEVLSSLKNFPQAKRLIIFFKKGSKNNIPLFRKLGFMESDCSHGGELHKPFTDISLLCYEKLMV